MKKKTLVRSLRKREWNNPEIPIRVGEEVDQMIARRSLQKKLFHATLFLENFAS